MNLRKILDYSSDVYAHASKVAKDRGRGAQSQRLAKGASEKLYQELRDYEPDGSESEKPEISTGAEPAYDDEYADLGLPSGTLWKSHEEDGYYTCEEALGKFGNSLPTKQQFQELFANCDYDWDKVKKGAYFTSKINGNYLFLPAAGHCTGSAVSYEGSCGCYWSLSTDDYIHTCCLCFEPNKVSTHSFYNGLGNSVILVK